MVNNNNQPEVIYIIGGGRSGSSILSILLGNHQDFVNLGEVKRWAMYNGLLDATWDIFNNTAF